MSDLEVRLTAAARTLGQLLDSAAAADPPNETEIARLRGKREGVELALSYVREADRIARVAR